MLSEDFFLSSSAFGRSLLFLFRAQCSIFLFLFFFSEGTSVKPMAVELSDNSLPRN